MAAYSRVQDPNTGWVCIFYELLAIGTDSVCKCDIYVGEPLSFYITLDSLSDPLIMNAFESKSGVPVAVC